MVNGMRKYWIQNEKSPLPALTGANFDPDACDFCRETEFAAIDQYVWQGDYRCEARAYVARGADALNLHINPKRRKRRFMWKQSASTIPSAATAVLNSFYSR